jgi:pyruvate carboxylase
VAVYSKEDKHALHRYKAGKKFFFSFCFVVSHFRFVPDESFVVGEDQTPVGAYLDFKDMVKIAVENNVGKWDFGVSFFSRLFLSFSFFFCRDLLSYL